MSESSNEPKAQDMFKGHKMNSMMAPRSDYLEEQKFKKMLKYWDSPDSPAPKLTLVIKPKVD